MFETVAPTAAGRPSRSALYEALSFSLCIHAAAGIAAAGTYLWEVSFPTASPAAMVSFVLAAPTPPPPPPPPPRPQPVTQEKVATTQKVFDNLFLAPTVIPDTIPIVKPQVTMVDLSSTKGVAGGVEGGYDFGVLGGSLGGDNGGVPGGTPGSVAAAPDGRVHIPRDKKLPLTAMSQVYPSYPEDARIRGWEDELVVRYVIGRDGRVKEVTVVQNPNKQVFVDETVRAIRSWRFKPYMKDGEAQEVVHELTIYYRLYATSS